MKQQFPVVAGFGLSGQALARYFTRHHQPFFWWSPNPTDLVPWAAYRVAVGKWPADWDVQIDGIYLSPGLSPALLRSHLPLHLLAKTKTEWDLPVDLHYDRGCAVTGTNGKSSVVLALTYLLQQFGQAAATMGNWGISPLDLTDLDLIPVIEWSSAQLAHMYQVPATKVGVLTNLDIDHLSWHDGSQEFYQAAKFRIFSTAKYSVAPVHLIKQSSRPNQFGFHLEKPSDCDAGIVTYHRQPWFSLPGGELLLPVDKFSCRADFYLENRLAIATAAWLMGLPPQFIAEQLPHLPRLPARQEPYYDRLGRLWINDSKATCLHAVLAAKRALPTSAYPRQIWFLGGQHKLPLTPQGFWPISEQADWVVFFGQHAEQLAEGWPNQRFSIVKELYLAVAEALQHSAENTIFVFSPGGASFDAYAGFKSRGLAFINAINRLVR